MWVAAFVSLWGHRKGGDGRLGQSGRCPHEIDCYEGQLSGVVMVSAEARKREPACLRPRKEFPGTALLKAAEKLHGTNIELASTRIAWFPHAITKLVELQCGSDCVSVGRS